MSPHQVEPIPSNETHGAEPAMRPVARRALVITVVLAAGAIGVLYFVLPRLAGLDETWQRINEGDPWWLGLAAVLEVASFAGYMVLFRAVFAHQERIDWRVSYEVTMAGVGATRLFATAGIGGILLTVWAVTKAGMPRRAIAQRMTAFLVSLYAVFMLALVVGGLGLRLGLFGGPAPFALTVIPAAFGAGVIVTTLALSLLPPDAGARLAARVPGPELLRRAASGVGRATTSIADGIRIAIDLARRGRIGLLGAPAWWAFDIAVLWASFHAFGEPPPTAVLVVAYFTGMLANTLPLPGGIGGVEGGMIGALIGFGVAGGLAIVAVLTYRAFAFWLPTIPGAIAYLQLRRTVQEWDAQPAG